MRGIEVLKEELKKRGAKGGQLETPVIDWMLEILSGESGIDARTCLDELKEKYKLKIAEYQKEREKACDLQGEYILKINSLSNIDERIKDFEQKKEELEEQRKEFESLLENFSTYEAADRYRLACIYENKCLKMALDNKAMLTFMRKYGDILSGNTDSNIILNEKKRDIVNEKKEDIVNPFTGEVVKVY